MRPPCTRGLAQFSDGCPKRPWDSDTGEGCPLWIEKEVPTIEDPQPKMKRMCLDLWQWHWDQSVAGHLAGIQAVLEQTRNGLLFYDSKTKTVLPKPDYATLELVRDYKQRMKELDYSESQKAIDYDQRTE